jgi:hypothetical protein
LIKLKYRACFDKNFGVHDDERYVFVSNLYIAPTLGWIKESNKLKIKRRFFIFKEKSKKYYNVNVNFKKNITFSQKVSLFTANVW